MRAAVMHDFSPDLLGELVSIEEREKPIATEPHDVVVRITGAGVCRTELHILQGEFETDLPHVLGHENAGIVEAVGAAVNTVAPGDAVVCYPFLSDGLSPAERRALDTDAPDRLTPGIDAPGGFAEYLLSNERAMVRLPQGTDPSPLAPLTDAGLAAYRACGKVRVSPGHTVVVMGVGGLGHLAIQILAATTPARIIGVDPRADARALGIECGAHEVIEPDELEGRAGTAAAVLDFVGSDETLSAGLAALGFGGQLISVGVGGTLSVPIFDLVTTEKQVEGVYVGTYQDLVEVTELALAGAVVPRVSTYPLDDADRALHDLAAGSVVGRALLVP